MPFAAAWRNNLLDRALSNTAFTVPSSILWTPYSAAPASDGSGGTEYTSNGAARRTVTWGTASLGSVSNSTAVTAGTASADWALITNFALLSNAGAVIAFGPTTPSKTVLSGQTWTLQIGEIQLADAGQSLGTFLSYFTINGLFTELCGGGATTWPTSPWWGLGTAAFGRDGTGGTEVSTSGTGYGRVQVGMSPAASGSKSPSSAITFGTPSTGWGTVTHLTAWTASTGGTLLGQLALATPLTVGTGVAPTFAAANQAFTLT